MHRRRVAALIALLAAGAAYARALPLEPHLEITVRRVQHSGSSALYGLHVKSRGGETLDVRVEVLRGPVGLVLPHNVRQLAPGSTFSTQVTVSGATTVPPAVRIVQEGRVSRNYDVDLEEWRLR